MKKSSLLRIPFSLKCFYLPGQNFLVLNFKYEFICACLQTDFLRQHLSVGEDDRPLDSRDRLVSALPELTTAVTPYTRVFRTRVLMLA